MDPAGNVTLGDVRDFVRQHARQLILRARRVEQSRVDADEPAGQGERVDHRAVDHEERKLVVAVGIGLRGQAIADLVDIFGDLGILDDFAAGADLRHDRAAQAILLVLGQDGVGGAADVRQIDLRGRQRWQEAQGRRRAKYRQFSCQVDHSKSLKRCH